MTLEEILIKDERQERFVEAVEKMADAFDYIADLLEEKIKGYSVQTDDIKPKIENEMVKANIEKAIRR